MKRIEKPITATQLKTSLYQYSLWQNGARTFAQRRRRIGTVSKCIIPGTWARIRIPTQCVYSYKILFCETHLIQDIGLYCNHTVIKHFSTTTEKFLYFF